MSWSWWKETHWKERIKASLISQHEVQRRSFMIWWKSGKEHVHEPMALCVFCMCQVQEVHGKYPLNSKKWWKMLTKEKKPPIRLMASNKLHKFQCVNIFLVVEHKGNHPVNDQWWNVDCWVQGYLQMGNSRTMVHNRTTTSCDYETNWGYGQHAKSRFMRSG